MKRKKKLAPPDNDALFSARNMDPEDIEETFKYWNEVLKTVSGFDVCAILGRSSFGAI